MELKPCTFDMDVEFFNPAKHISDQSGKVFFITGGTAGLGKLTILALVGHHPGHIYFTGRNKSAAKQVIEECKAIAPRVPVTFIACEQSSLDSVSQAAQQFLAASTRLDVLICNAGIMGKPCGLTHDGYEQHFGINHLAHALFVKLFIPLLQKTQTTTCDARIIFLTSLHFKTTVKGGIAFQDLKTVQNLGREGAWVRYGQSKLANIIYAAELARRYPEICSVSVHPGTIATDIFEQMSLRIKIATYGTNLLYICNPEFGALQPYWACTVDKSYLRNGELYEAIGQPGQCTQYSSKVELWEELWDWTDKELARYN